MNPKTSDAKALRKTFIDTLYQTMDGAVSPTPYLEIKEGKTVDVRILDGKGRLPTPGTTEVTILDLDTAALFFDDFNLLYEGETGVGKTYTSDALFGTIFGPEGHYTIRLSGGLMGSSALEPFTKTALEGGVPKTRIDHDKCSKYGALFIDEINRGDPQEVFQVVDGKIHINGDTGYLRVPIPGTNRYKSLAIIAAMNPSDVQHSAALELDIAGENRFLKFRFPNGVAEAGSSQLEKRVAEGLHDRFWTTFRKRTGREGGWKENYPIITDPEQFSESLDGQTREFIDTALGYVGYDPKETCARNADLLKQAGVQPHSTIRDDNDYKKIREAQNTLKHGFVRRDLRKISDLSRLLAFVKGIKSGSGDADVSINDAAAAMGIILESKSATGTPYGPLMALVNDARSAYGELHKQLSIESGYGIRQAVWQRAMLEGQEKGMDAYQKTLDQGIAHLNTQTPTAAPSTLRSRLAADLAVLNHFSTANEADVKAALKEKGAAGLKAFEEIFDKRKSQSSVYEHRLNSIMR